MPVDPNSLPIPAPTIRPARFPRDSLAVVHDDFVSHHPDPEDTITFNELSSERGYYNALRALKDIKETKEHERVLDTEGLNQGQGQQRARELSSRKRLFLALKSKLSEPMNNSVADASGSILIITQTPLWGYGSGRSSSKKQSLLQKEMGFHRFSVVNLEGPDSPPPDCRTTVHSPRRSSGPIVLDGLRFWKNYHGPSKHLKGRF